MRVEKIRLAGRVWRKTKLNKSWYSTNKSSNSLEVGCKLNLIVSYVVMLFSCL